MGPRGAWLPLTPTLLMTCLWSHTYASSSSSSNSALIYLPLDTHSFSILAAAAAAIMATSDARDPAAWDLVWGTRLRTLACPLLPGLLPGLITGLLLGLQADPFLWRCCCLPPCCCCCCRTPRGAAWRIRGHEPGLACVLPRWMVACVLPRWMVACRVEWPCSIHSTPRPLPGRHQTPPACVVT